MRRLAIETLHHEFRESLRAALRRDPGSTSYAGTFAGCREIAALLRQEALHRGMGRAGWLVCLGDGAARVWENCRRTFPGAVGIPDLWLLEPENAVEEFLAFHPPVVHHPQEKATPFAQGPENFLREK